MKNTFARRLLYPLGLAVTLAMVLPLPAATPSSGLTRSPWQIQAEQQRNNLLARMGADRWQTAGVRGQGVKIAVLDTGFRGYRAFLGKVLPAAVVARSFRTDGNFEARDSQHGILCGEVIHAIAPDAELLFANWDTEYPEQFLAAAKWARQQGARIISCSVVMPNCSDGEGRGELHDQLAQVLGSGAAPDDLLCFASAGNTTVRHWSGSFHDGETGWHEWKPGLIDNGINPWSNEKCSVELYWKPGADYDLSVSDTTTGREVGVAHTSHHHGDHNSAVVYFQPELGHGYRARVRLAHGPAGTFHLCTMESYLEQTTARGSVCFPADGPEVIAMGAADGSGHKLGYSACGPNSPRPKPDFVAIIPFPSLWRERPFAGTSAAAPQGAAQAALWWARHPRWTADKIRASIKASAQDLGPPGHDIETGYGLIHLPRE
jgi:subtilisin family serine protease